MSVSTQGLQFSKISLSKEYHVNKLIVDDGYNSELDSEFKPQVFTTYIEAAGYIKNLSSEFFITEVIVPDYKRKKQV